MENVIESAMKGDTNSIKACVHSTVCHLYCDIVTIKSAKAERQRRYIARIKADPHKRGEFLMKDRLRKKNMVMTRHETRHDFRKELEMLLSLIHI